VQVHTLGEVGILLHRFVKGLFQDNLSNFIEIGSYLTDKEQKDKLAQFF